MDSETAQNQLHDLINRMCADANNYGVEEVDRMNLRIHLREFFMDFDSEADEIAHGEGSYEQQIRAGIIYLNNRLQRLVPLLIHIYPVPQILFNLFAEVCSGLFIAQFYEMDEEYRPTDEEMDNMALEFLTHAHTVVGGMYLLLGAIVIEDSDDTEDEDD